MHLLNSCLYKFRTSHPFPNKEQANKKMFVENSCPEKDNDAVEGSTAHVFWVAAQETGSV